MKPDDAGSVPAHAARNGSAGTASRLPEKPEPLCESSIKRRTKKAGGYLREINGCRYNAALWMYADLDFCTAVERNFARLPVGFIYGEDEYDKRGAMRTPPMMLKQLKDIRIPGPAWGSKNTARPLDLSSWAACGSDLELLSTSSDPQTKKDYRQGIRCMTAYPIEFKFVPRKLYFKDARMPPERKPDGSARDGHRYPLDIEQLNLDCLYLQGSPRDIKSFYYQALMPLDTHIEACLDILGPSLEADAYPEPAEDEMPDHVWDAYDDMLSDDERDGLDRQDAWEQADPSWEVEPPEQDSSAWHGVARNRMHLPIQDLARRFLDLASAVAQFNDEKGYDAYGWPSLVDFQNQILNEAMKEQPPLTPRERRSLDAPKPLPVKPERELLTETIFVTPYVLMRYHGLL